MSIIRTNKLLVSGAVLSGLFLTGMATTAKADSTDLGESSGPISQSTQSTTSVNSSTTQASSANATSTTGQTAQATASNNQQLTGATGIDGFNTEVVFTRPVSRSSSAKTATATSDAESTVAPTPAPTPAGQQQQSQTVASEPEAATEAIEQPTTTPQAEAPTQKTELTLEPTQTSIKSGQAASFDLKLAVAAITQNLNQQRLVINVPTNVKLVAGTDLAINGVTPTLSSDGTQYTYEFPGATNGLSVSKQFLFDTADAGLPNGSQLTMAASYFDGDTEQAATGDKTVTVTSEAVYGATNRMVGVLKLDENGTPLLDDNGDAQLDSTKKTGIAGDYLVYQLGISAPKSTIGQAFFEPNQPIQMLMVIPNGMTYWKTDNATIAKFGEPMTTTLNGQVVLGWNVPAPSIAEQQAATDNLFDGYFDVALRINPTTPGLTELTTQARATALSINGTSVTSKVATSTITTAFDFSHNNTPTDGTTMANYNWGPKDGKGNRTDSALNHVDPQVYPGDTLGFLMWTGADEFNYPDGDLGVYGKYSITKYVATYNVDPHLNVDVMSIAAPQSYPKGTKSPLLEDPVASVYVRYQDETEFETTPIMSNITTTGGDVDMSQYVDNARGVAQLKFDYSVHPQGLSTLVYFKMSPKAGYYGTVSNDFTLEIAGFDAADWEDVLISKDGAIVQYSTNKYSQRTDRIGTDIHQYDNIGKYAPGTEWDHSAMYNQYMQPQTAEVVKPAENTPRVINEALSFTNNSNGYTETGDNVLNVFVENNQASLQGFSGLKSFVFLPKGVTYTGDDSRVTTSEAANGSMLNIDWGAGSTLSPNQKNRLALNVNIDSGLNLSTVTPVIYSTVNETDTVVPGAIEGQADTGVQEVADAKDIDGNAATTQMYVYQLTSNLVTNTHQVLVSATATNAGGTTGSLVDAQPGTSASYGIQFAPSTDKALQNVEIVGSLPTTGDTGLVDESSRGSDATVAMSGPIILPEAWEGLATVSYALKDDPTTYVSGDAVTDFAQVTGFKIDYNGDSFLSSDAATLQIPVTVAADAKPGQNAYISYSVTANGLLTTEGSKAGLKVVAKATPGGNGGGGGGGTTETVPTPPTTPVTTPEEPVEVPVGYAKENQVVYAIKGIAMYSTPTFSRKTKVASYKKKAREYRPMFVVIGYAYSKAGRLRYQVKDVNHLSDTAGMVGYITARRSHVIPVYYSLKNRPTTITVISPKGVNTYRNKGLTGKRGHVKQGTVLRVVGMTTHNLTTRFKLSNGTYITANKKLVIVGKYKMPKVVQAKGAVNRYDTANLTGRNRHFKAVTKQRFKVLGWDYSHGNNVHRYGVKRYRVAGGYITANARFVKTVR